MPAGIMLGSMPAEVSNSASVGLIMTSVIMPLLPTSINGTSASFADAVAMSYASLVIFM